MCMSDHLRLVLTLLCIVTLITARRLDNHEMKRHESECPPGVPFVACFVDPCSVTECPLFPNAQCISNYCGGCYADFYVDGKLVDCTDTGVSGDPHMTTFDGRKYSFQGLCWYTLFKDCSSTNPDFEVTTMFEPREDSSFEHVKTRTVSINITVGNEYAIVNGLDVVTGKTEGHGTAAQAINVQHEDKKIKLSFISKDTKFTVNWTVKKHILNVSFSGNAYNNKLCGLLGNADGDTRNDFQTPDGAVIRDAVEFGESWKVKGKECD
ncbi:BMP-binding endothelial regulator protein-like isoform X2 [Saccoglossus kowalevskii]